MVRKRNSLEAFMLQLVEFVEFKLFDMLSDIWHMSQCGMVYYLFNYLSLVELIKVA